MNAFWCIHSNTHCFLCHAAVFVWLQLCHACHVFVTECDDYLQLHEGDDPQYLLPGEEHAYKCVETCASPNEIRNREGISFCDGEMILVCACGSALNGVLLSVWS